MDISDVKARAQQIMSREPLRTAAVCFLAFITECMLLTVCALSIYFSAAVGTTTFFTARTALCAFSAVLSLFFYTCVRFNKKRWFYKNSFAKIPVSALFKREKFSVRIKVFYLFFFKKTMGLLCFILCEIPFFASLALLLYRLQNGSMYKNILYILFFLTLTLFLTGGFFALALNKSFYLCEKLYFKEKNCKIAEAVKKSCRLTDGKRFRLVMFDLSFVFRYISCLFVIPALYTAPFVCQCYGSLPGIFPKLCNPDEKSVPIVFMKPKSFTASSAEKASGAI